MLASACSIQLTAKSVELLLELNNMFMNSGFKLIICSRRYSLAPSCSSSPRFRKIVKRGNFLKRRGDQAFLLDIARSISWFQISSENYSSMRYDWLSMAFELSLSPITCQFITCYCALICYFIILTQLLLFAFLVSLNDSSRGCSYCNEVPAATSLCQGANEEN